MANWKRRDFVKCASLLAGAGLAPLGRALPAGQRSYRADFPDMLLAHLAGQLNALAAQWDEVRNNIGTAAEVETRNRFVREKMGRMIGDFPERGPLRTTVTATRERDGYRVENLMFQSRPDFWVTANLYLPRGTGPFPAIISPCGHYLSARMEPQYQFVYLNLVRSGFVVLAYDPVGQGERRQYWNPQTGETELGYSPTYEHSMAGQLLLLLGENLTNYRVWDGMRAIDYLLTRPEVDGKRIGCAGHSGGGSMTRFIAALDERVQCAVINEGGTANRWPVRLRSENRLALSDAEQNLFPAAVHGIDNCDMHVAIAPRPLLVLIENYSPDFDSAAASIRKRYQQLGVLDRFATEEATDPHAWTPKLRLATADWFSRWFYGRRGPKREPDFEAEAEQTLYVTPTGSLRYAQLGDTIFSLILKKQQRLPPPREVPRGAAEHNAFRNQMVSEIVRLLHYRKPNQDLVVRRLVTTPRKDYQIEKMEFLSEPGIYVPAWMFVPERPVPGRAIVYVSEAGIETDGMELGPLERLVRKGRLVIAVDVRGVGGTRTPHPDDRGGSFSHLFNAETALTYMTWFLDRSLLGMRVQDVVRSVDFTLSLPGVEQRGVSVIGKDGGALWALFAAALDPRIAAVVAQGGLLSYGSLAASDRYLHGAHVFVRDVLKSFDLPQVAAAVAGRRLILLSPVDPMQKPVTQAVAERVYDWARQAFANAGAAEQFQILSGGADLDAHL